MLKKILCMLLVFVFTVLVFAGCGGDDVIVDESYYDVAGDTIVGDSVTETSSNQTTSVNKAEKSETVGSVDYSFDITKAEMPTRKLKNKTITYYHWEEFSTNPDSANVLMQKEFGVKFKAVLGTHANYWDNLATLVASNKSPDIVIMPNWNYYPTPMANNLIQPLDSYIDVESKLWEDTYAFSEEIKWKNKHYVLANSVDQDSWLYYNTQMFKNFGVTKTPKDYFLEDNWTWATMKELADKFVTLKADGTNKTAGICFQSYNINVTTGVELFEVNGSNYKFNLKDSKITSLMNFLHTMGKAGTKSLINANDAISAFANSEVAMIVTKEYAFNEERWAKVRKNTEFVPMPKMDKNSDYYVEYAINPAPAIANGSKNPEGAALYIEFNHWLQLGWKVSGFVKSSENAATKKYKINPVDDTKNLSKEELEWVKTIYDKYDYKYVTINWASWSNAIIGESRYPGMRDVIDGKAWSAALQEYYPVYESGFKKYAG